jgi:hypothetical protein
MKNSKKYISFCGEFIVPTNVKELEKKYPQIEGVEKVWDEYSDEYVDEKHYEEYRDLSYKEIDGKDSLSVRLAIIDDKTGHLVADCTGSWIESTFVVLENGLFKRPKTNFNPNPVRQLGN